MRARKSAGGGDLVSNDLFQFEILTLMWTKLDTAAGVKEAGPSARRGHAMTSVGDSTVLLFGGDCGTDGENPATAYQ